MPEQKYTLAEAEAILRDRLFEQLDDGTHCPVCTQYAKRYRRPLTSAMAYALVLVAKELLSRSTRPGLNSFEREWLHVENFLKNYPGIPSSIRGDFAKLQHWGLVAPAWGLREDGSKRNGYYKVTPGGYDFVHGRFAIPSHVTLYNNKRQGHSSPGGKPISIKDALGKQFNYREIMQDVSLPAEPAPVPPPTQLFDTTELERKPRRVTM